MYIMKLISIFGINIDIDNKSYYIISIFRELAILLGDIIGYKMINDIGNTSILKYFLYKDRKYCGDNEYFLTKISLLLLLILRQFRFRLLRSPFQGRQDLLWLLRILLLPYLLRHTNGQRLSWHTSSRICDQVWRRLRQWRWC